mgnify:CR=1 FL=1
MRTAAFRNHRLIAAAGWMRAVVRARLIAFALLSAAVGLVAGLCVAAMSFALQTLHEVLFDLPAGERLSAAASLLPWRVVAAPVLGGALLALLGLWLRRRKWKPVVDPVEANALHGGRMAVGGSLRVGLQCLLSTGFGASVGLEAGYTQVAAGLASRIGRVFRVRRSDLRTLVGCGAAGAISAAFGAPFAGAFYAFELIIGGYRPNLLAPVMISALIASFVAGNLVGTTYTVHVGAPVLVKSADYPAFALLGLLCGLLGIALMVGVTRIEQLCRRAGAAAPALPIAGGAIVGLLALLSPAVLSGGHGALHLGLEAARPWTVALLLLLLKGSATAVSLGTGFRGGVFFASLFLGSLLGTLFAAAVQAAAPGLAVDPVACALAGMAAFAAAVVGGPMTMIMLALEMTGSLAAFPAVSLAVVLAALLVRQTFGYSFTTWRFHLRGEVIRSPHDIGWLHNLKVGRIMRLRPPTTSADQSLKAFCRAHPLSGEPVVALTDQEGRYAGLVLVATAHANMAADETVPLSSSMIAGAATLGPAATLAEALNLFAKGGSDVVAVVEPSKGTVVGLLTETQALRRYSEELYRQESERWG